MNVVERLLPVFDAYQEAYKRIRAGEPGPFEIADATLAQDIEDGTALRLLREALDDGGWHPIEVRWWSPKGLPTIDAAEVQLRVRIRPRVFVNSGSHPTIAAAADACRAALEATK